MTEVDIGDLRRQILKRIFDTSIILAECDLEKCLRYEPGHGDMFVTVVKGKRYRFGAIEPALSFYTDPESAEYKGKIEYCSCSCSKEDHKNDKCKHKCVPYEKEKDNGSQSSSQEVPADQSAGTGSSNPEGGNPESQSNLHKTASGTGLEEKPGDKANRSEEPQGQQETHGGSPESMTLGITGVPEDLENKTTEELRKLSCGWGIATTPAIIFVYSENELSDSVRGQAEAVVKQAYPKYEVRFKATGKIVAA